MWSNQYALVLTFVFSSHSSRFGRKTVLFGGSAMLSVSTVALAFAPSWPVFLALFFLAGINQIPSFLSGFVLGKTRTVLADNSFEQTRTPLVHWPIDPVFRLRDPDWFSESSLHQPVPELYVRAWCHTAADHWLLCPGVEVSVSVLGCARPGVPALLVVSLSQKLVKTEVQVELLWIVFTMVKVLMFNRKLRSQGFEKYLPLPFHFHQDFLELIFPRIYLSGENNFWWSIWFSPQPLHCFQTRLTASKKSFTSKVTQTS